MARIVDLRFPSSNAAALRAPVGAVCFSVMMIGALGLVTGCSSSTEGDPGGTSPGAIANDPSGDVAPGGGPTTPGPTGGPVETPLPTPIDELTVDTGVSDDGPAAGQEVQVFCTVEGLAEDQEAPATHWELVDGPELAPTSIDGEFITFEQVGVYTITCFIDETSWTDPSPVKVQVHAAEAVEIDTVVGTELLTAGDTTNVECIGSDAWGNEIEADEWTVNVAPGGSSPGEDFGLVESQFNLKGLIVGTYEVACQQTGGTTDETPAMVTVEHGLPHRIITTLGSDWMTAGTETSLECRAEDKQGNHVPDLPMTVNMPANLGLAGFNITGTVAGTYAVKCVPTALEWNAFVLVPATIEVVPDTPISLEIKLQPPKSFFTTYELVTIVPQARDQYDNLVPNAELEPIEVNPDNGQFTDTTPVTFIFFEDGEYTLTARLAVDPEIEHTVPILIDGAPPTITVTEPLRGATVLNSKPSVTIKGFANDTIAGINAVRVNGDNATLHDDGTWSTIVIPDWGLNILFIEAEDGDGNVTDVTQSFYFAELYHVMEPSPDYVPDAIKAWMDEKFIDDGVHNPTKPDDLATILEGVVAGMDFNGLFGSAMEVGAGYELKIKHMTMNPPKLNLDPVHGGMDIHTEIKNLSIGISLEGECKVLGIDLCPDFSGSVNVGIVSLDADLQMSAVKSVMSIALLNPQVELQALDIDIDGILGWLFDWLLDFIVGLFVNTIEDTIEEQMGDLLGDALGEIVDGLAISETLEMEPLMPGMDPLSMTFESNIWTMTFTPDGGQLGLGARLLSAKQVPQWIHGAPSRGTCVKGYQSNYYLPGENDFEGALYDDFINEALVAIWQTGTMNVSLDQEAMAELLGGDGAQDALPIPVDDMTLDMQMLLPPILNGCDPGGLMLLQIGDLFVDMDMVSPLFGDEPGEMGVYISLEIGAEIVMTETDEGDAIGVILTGIERIEYHWEYVPELFVGSEDVLEELLNSQLVEGMFEDLGAEPLGNIVIPQMDLSEISTLFPPGSLISPVIDDIIHEDGHTWLGGYLE